jgi:hypothetical protein
MRRRSSPQRSAGFRNKNVAKKWQPPSWLAGESITPGSQRLSAFCARAATDSAHPYGGWPVRVGT